MIVDVEQGLVGIPIGLFIWMVGLALFGILMAGVMFVVACSSMIQRYYMRREVDAYAKRLENAGAIALAQTFRGDDSFITTWDVTPSTKVER